MGLASAVTKPSSPSVGRVCVKMPEVTTDLSGSLKKRHAGDAAN